ncbi:MAG: 4-hydroxythreonine-4-phosphate dehydrogenase PdxA [Deltaproteobacteria bacterium]|nr:4-hydroxythreonine-4-phosphate dehydrogenase PdxA [Deltaproteobacteria bacterium]
MKPVIAITMGDPVGVGPEIVLKALSSAKIRRILRPVVLGDEGLLRHIAKRLRLPPPKKGDVINLSSLDPRRLKPGQPARESANAMVAYIEEAVCMAGKGDCAAMVTAPINKKAASLAGFGFPGHTEFIAHLTGTKDFRMMLGGRSLKVVLVTIHEPMKKVPRLLTAEKIFKTIKITDESFKRYFALKRPRIAVCGLNPHAGENGLFGEEEDAIIAPAVKKARLSGMNAVGPLPPDTTFFRAVNRKEFDCVVCMYHDQGLIPLKLLHFEDGVNVTLGLPIIRTSVDHGTAYDIAWKGAASPKSMIAALKMAAEMAKRKA